MKKIVTLVTMLVMVLTMNLTSFAGWHKMFEFKEDFDKKVIEQLKEDFKEDKWDYVIRDDDYNMFVIDLVAKDDSGKIKLYFYEDKIYSTIEYYYTTKDGRDWINRDSQECYADEKLYNDVYNGDVNIVKYIHDNSEDF